MRVTKPARKRKPWPAAPAFAWMPRPSICWWRRWAPTSPASQWRSKSWRSTPGNRQVGVDDIAALVPDARSSTVFALVNALGRRDRARALEVLDTLSREGEYLPLALAFLSTQFRMALVAREAGLKSAQQIQSHFTRAGVPMWSSRAEQVYQTATKFSKPQLERAMGLIYAADKGMRDARPDDRIVMEQFIVQLVR